MTKNNSFGEFQKFLKRCYGKVNHRNYTKADLALKIQLYAQFAMKRLGQGRLDEAAPNLAIALAWAIGLANRLDITLDSTHSGEIWFRYPGMCPYCGTKPCSCKERAKERLHIPLAVRRHKPDEYNSIDSLQRLFAEIYPNNTTTGSCLHLGQEMVEVAEAVHLHDATHKKEMFVKIKEELVDVVAWIFAVATTHNIRLAEEIAKLYPDNRCHKCGRRVCKCGFTIGSPVTLSINISL